MALAADDDVVVDGDAERPRRIDDLLRHVDVGARRRRIAGGVVVHEDDRRGRQLQRPLDHLAHIDRRVIDGALLLHLVGDQLVPLVEEQDAELLAVLEALRGAAIVEHLLPTMTAPARCMMLALHQAQRGGADQLELGDRPLRRRP